MPQDYPKDFIELCKSVTAKRARTVIDHILMYGHISTEELMNKYGYNHPPRAVRDVREHGISIETFRITGSDGRKIAAYRFSDVTKKRFEKLSGRTGLSKKIKKYLINKFGSKCFIYLEEINEGELQIDHRIPFEVGKDGENIELNPDDFMLLSASANRAKSWSCEHCENWQTLKKRDICLSCYWAYPQDYAHVAMQQVRRVDLIWQNKEIEQYERLKNNASVSSQTIPEFIKEIVRKALEDKNSN